MKREPEDINREMRVDPRHGGKQYPDDTEQDVNPAASVITRPLRSRRAAVLACTDSPISSAVYYTADLTATPPACSLASACGLMAARHIPSWRAEGLG